MENYKVKLVVLDKDDNVLNQSVTTSDVINDLRKLHNVSALDEQLDMLLHQIKK